MNIFTKQNARGLCSRKHEGSIGLGMYVYKEGVRMLLLPPQRYKVLHVPIENQKCIIELSLLELHVFQMGDLEPGRFVECIVYMCELSAKPPNARFFSFYLEVDNGRDLRRSRREFSCIC